MAIKEKHTEHALGQETQSDVEPGRQEGRFTERNTDREAD